LLDGDPSKIALANALLFSLPGAPFIYYGDEIGMGDDIILPDRNGVRTPMQWSNSSQAGFSSAEKLYSPVISSPPYSPEFVNVEAQKVDPQSLWHTIQRMIRIRKDHTALSTGKFIWLDCGQEAVFAFLREHRDERILVINNLSSQPMQVTCPIQPASAEIKNILTQQIVPFDGSRTLFLKPYEYLWLKV
jgi:maltose alpha-D-glucosyltransferase/alpha-amylase